MGEYGVLAEYLRFTSADLLLRETYVNFRRKSIIKFFKNLKGAAYV